MCCNVVSRSLVNKSILTHEISAGDIAAINHSFYMFVSWLLSVGLRREIDTNSIPKHSHDSNV